MNRQQLPHIREIIPLTSHENMSRGRPHRRKRRGTQGPRRRNKYNAQKIKIDGLSFDSKKEARYYEDLKIRKRIGDVSWFLVKVPFRIPGGVVYWSDFVEFWPDGSIHVIDVKGKRTPQYKNKKKLVEYNFPVEIEEK